VRPQPLQIVGVAGQHHVTTTRRRRHHNRVRQRRTAHVRKSLAGLLGELSRHRLHINRQKKLVSNVGSTAPPLGDRNRRHGHQEAVAARELQQAQDATLSALNPDQCSCIQRQTRH
jgi:hypothetical protein